MRGTKAKRLRRMVYGDLSQKEPTRYLRHGGLGIRIVDPNSLRGIYLAIKRRNKHV